MYKEIKNYCVGKSTVMVDDILTMLDVAPDTASRRKVADILVELGWVKGGRKRVDGVIRNVWNRVDSKEKTALEVQRLELINQRQNNDMDMITQLLDKGFSKEQTLNYLAMLYNSNIDRLDLAKEDEQESSEFADSVIDAIGGKPETIKMIWSSAYMYYIEKYFPELATSDRYLAQDRKVNANLMWHPSESSEKREFNALAFSPNFLDMCIRMPSKGEIGEFRIWILESYISPQTIDKLFGGELNTKLIGATCILARKIAVGLEFSLPFGVDKPWAIKAYNYLKNLQNYE